MKRKLIDLEVFKKIQEDSLSVAEFELQEAEGVLAKAIDVDELNLHCFGDSDVTYQTESNSYVHATYHIVENNIIFENIEELIIDEHSAKKETRSLVSNMVEAILDNNDTKAAEAFNKYLASPNVRRDLMEGDVDFWVEKPGTKTKKPRGKQSPSDIAKRVRAKKVSQSKTPQSEKDAAKVRRKSLKAQFGKDTHVHARFTKTPKKKLKEWANLAEGVINYLDYQEFGPTIQESEVRHDDKGNVVAVKIPTAHARNEGKILTLNYKHMLDTEVKVLRSKVKNIHEEASFCHAVNDLRKANALSNETDMHNVLEAIVKKWPDLMYLTQAELAQNIGNALEALGETHYDDDACNFMAEGILRTAVDAYTERASRVVKLSGNELDKENVYESFQKVAESFFGAIDESSRLEMQVFVDLYNTLVEVHGFAKSEGNNALKSEANDFLEELHAVIHEEKEPSLDLAEEVVVWLQTLVEANVPGATEDWDVSNTPHQTVNGDHPRTSWNAKQAGNPSGSTGDWGDEAPVSDGKSYKGNSDEMRNRSWGNWSSEDTWPGLKNPYTPKPFGDYKMKEKSAVDDGTDDWSRFQSKDTWPNLENPNQKPSPWDTSKYKAKTDNLVVDK